ncbi:calpain-10 [Lampris incognitus]|uniref:calpain-10 n=1 Tax=Lampris incognitus TaxID=2546036 RepID=UPI0024B5B137|nr:calpain-10 [Lampris incognitus]
MEEEERDECRSEGLFEDPDFTCDDTSLFSDYSTPIAKLQRTITWHRPQEICVSPALFPDNVNEGHAKQGSLGDCWFLCACTILIKNKHLMDKVIPPDQPMCGDGRYRGCFHFRLWRLGHWTEVTIDDRLPCIGSMLCFSRCQTPNVFWIALLEKAYAKFYGSYERLWAGQVSEALVDLTGGLAERLNLAKGGLEEELGTEQDSDRVRRRTLSLSLLHPVRNGCAVSCCTHSSHGGAGEVDQYHAMSVMEWLDVTTVSGGQLQLLRIRNPWGRRCWGGDWVEGGAGWSSIDPACALDLQGRTKEGEFWLDKTEFLSQFDDVTVGYPINKEGHLQSIYTGNLLAYSHQLVGRWVRGHSAGGWRNNNSYCTNPKYWLKVAQRGEVLVSLLQHKKCRNNEQYMQRTAEDGNNTKHQRYQAIALHMWKVEKKRFNLSRMLNKPPCGSTHCHAYEREVVLHSHLEPGYHLLIPSAFLPGAEASFLIRVFSSSPTSLSALKTPGPSLPLEADGEWETSYFHGMWVKGTSAGGSRNFRSHLQNPCFQFTVCDDPASKPATNVRITLHQSRDYTDLHAIGFHIYKVPEGFSEVTLPRDDNPVASCVPHCYTQDVSLACCLFPGVYAVVPSTYQPDCPGNFTLSVERRIHRRVVECQERLVRPIQEVSHISVMHR